KGLKARGKAIRTALKKYNALAPLMTPPAPPLQWKDIVGYGFISEFELLKHAHSHCDITSLPWTIPGNREVAAKYFKIIRAYEELERLNVELRRLRTALEDEQICFELAYARLVPMDPSLAMEIRVRQQRRLRISQVHVRYIKEMQSLPGFSGTTDRGVHLGARNDTMNAT
ncbi:hypothetical protein GLOTRDRAFT_12384, partial [Gloeophyllum trabeum ATCC 11539]